MECTNYISSGMRVVRCGQCIECLKYKSWMWTQRVRVESLNVKTWFMTLTYAKSEKEGYRDVQLMLKRLRKKFSFRFLCVSELQKRGVLHYHLVVHGDLTRREVESEWNYGFHNAKLVKDSSIAKYIAKYLSKDTRKGKNYRASIGYGKAKENITENELVKAVFERFPDARVIGIAGVKVPYKFQHSLDTETKNILKLKNAHRRDGT